MKEQASVRSNSPKPIRTCLASWRMLACCLIALLYMVVFYVPSTVSAAADTVYVVDSFNDTVDANLADGLCQDASGKCTLRAAVMQSNASGGAHIIQLPKGTYTLELPGAFGENNAVSGDLDITSSITFTGAGGNRDGDPSLTVIQGGTSPTNGIDRVFDINPLTSNTGYNVTFEALTIENGRAASSNSYGGGGIAADTGNNGTLTVYNSVIKNNSVLGEADGGGIYVSGLNGGKVVIQHSMIQNNSAGARGGGIYVEGDVGLEIVDSTLDSNTVTALSNSLRSGLGGGLALVSETQAGSLVKISGSTISRNTVTNGAAGGIYLNSPATIVNSTISGNSATEDGGGMVLSYFGGSVGITNSTIYNNATQNGNGGGLYLEAGSPTLNNTIVARNLKAGTPNDILSSGGSSSLVNSSSGYNLIGTGGSGGLVNGTKFNKVGVSDPQLLPLTNNGGFTETHELAHTSLAVNAGDNTVVTSPLFIGTPFTDQRGTGYLRTIGSAVDIGAYEIQSFSSNANLSGLTLSSGSLNPVFDMNKTSYTAEVTNQVTSIKIIPTAADLYYTSITVKGAVVASGQTSSSINLTVGSNAIPIVVTAEDGTTNTYTVYVTRLSNDADLSGLSLTGGTLSPVFSSNTTSYSVTLPNNAASIQVIPTIHAAGLAVVMVNGKLVGSGEASEDIALVMGSNTITVLVTAQDGTTTKTYTITAIRQSNDATLSGLSLSVGTLSPVFSSDTTSYTVNVPNSVSALNVTSTVNAVGLASVKVNGNPVTSGQASGNIPLGNGENRLTVLVTAQDGTQQTYTIMVMRALSSNADLSQLLITEGALEPVFNQGTTAYTVTVANNVYSLKVTPTVSETGAATLKINGKPVVSGEPSGDLPLETGPNTITVEVRAEDGTVKPYTLVVTRLKNNNADLSALSLSEGVLAPSFDAGTTNYTVVVPNDAAALKVTPTVEAALLSTVKVNGKLVTSGQASEEVSLKVGANEIAVEVTAEDGTPKTYTIKVTRQSNDATLSGLTISGGALSPVFSASTMSYTASVPNSVGALNVTSTVNATGLAVVKVNTASATSGQPSADILLKVGENKILVEVTAEDGTLQTYTIVVTRERSSDADLSRLVLSVGILEPVFNQGTTAYTVTVSNNVYSLKVTPTVSAIGTAIVKINGADAVSGESSGDLLLETGPNTITVEVTAEDGTVKPYTLVVTRLKNSNADLSALSLSEGMVAPAFDAGTMNYSAVVANGVTILKVTPTVEAALLSTVKVNGKLVASGQASEEVSLKVGTNEIAVEVTAEDGTPKTYTIKVTRQSNDATLSGLTISAGTLSPLFSASTTSYTASVPNSVASLQVTPTAAAGGIAVVEVNAAPVASGQASGSIPLNVGANRVTVQVTAQDGTPQTYTIMVTRLEKSGDADLSSLQVTTGGLPVVLSPSFSMKQTTYTSTVAYNVYSVNVSAQASDMVHGKVSVTGATYGQAQGSSISGAEVVLNAKGTTTVSVVVTAENGQIQTYAVNITKADPAALLVMSAQTGGADARKIEVRFNQAITEANLDPSQFKVRINGSVRSVTEAVYSRSDSGKVILTLSDAPVALNDTVFLTIDQGAVTAVTGAKNSLISDVPVFNTALNQLRAELRALDTQKDGIHINEVLIWIKTQKRDLDGDGVFSASDITLLLQQIDTIIVK